MNRSDSKHPSMADSRGRRMFRIEYTASKIYRIYTFTLDNFGTLLSFRLLPNHNLNKQNISIS